MKHDSPAELIISLGGCLRGAVISQSRQARGEAGFPVDIDDVRGHSMILGSQERLQDGEFQSPVQDDANLSIDSLI